MRLIRILVFLIISISAFGQKSGNKIGTTEVQADTLLNRQDFIGALKLYNKVLKAKKSKEPDFILYKRAICYYSLGEFEKALKDLAIFLPAYPTFPQGKLLRAFVNRELGDAKAQLEDINELLAQNPYSVDLIRWKAGILIELEEYRQARDILQNLAYRERDEEIELYLGLAYYYLENPDSALLHFDEAIGLNGGYVPAYVYAASLCVEQAAYDLALTYCNLGLRLDSQNVDLILDKGIALVEKGNLDDGCSCLAQAFYQGADGAKGYLTEYCYNADD
jgi:tetratricopeptide (TPR) repeat protein